MTSNGPRKYMVMGCDPDQESDASGRQWVTFFEKLSAAEQYRMDGSVSMGYRMQIYEWSEEEDCYVFLSE